jgi:hypothetical protein
MRAFIWDRCLINGLTTWVVGYIVLIPYTLALTLATLRNGHSWLVRRGITPTAQLKRAWVNEPTDIEKALAIVAVPASLVPGIGILISWAIFWRVRWCTGWAYTTAEVASVMAYFATLTGASLWMNLLR